MSGRNDLGVVLRSRRMSFICEVFMRFSFSPGLHSYLEPLNTLYSSYSNPCRTLFQRGEMPVTCLTCSIFLPVPMSGERNFSYLFGIDGAFRPPDRRLV